MKWAFRVAQRHCIAHEIASSREVGIIESVSDYRDVFFRRVLVEARGKQAIVLDISSRAQEPGCNVAFGVLQDGFIDLYLIGACDFSVVRLVLTWIGVIVVSLNRSIWIKRTGF